MDPLHLGEEETLDIQYKNKNLVIIQSFNFETALMNHIFVVF